MNNKDRLFPATFFFVMLLLALCVMFLIPPPPLTRKIVASVMILDEIVISTLSEISGDKTFAVTAAAIAALNAIGITFIQ